MIELTSERKVHRIFASLWRWLRNDDSTPSRYASHLAIILVVAVVLSGGGFGIEELRRGEAFKLGMAPQEEVTFVSWGVGGQNDPDFLTRGAAPLTIIPERGRPAVMVYAVQSGDNVWKIAQRFGLQPETIIFSNPELERWPDYITIGQELFILPMDGAYHEVKAGDTVDSIAQQYDVDVSIIIESEYNDLEEPYQLQESQRLVVPGGWRALAARYVYATAPAPADAPQGSGNFMWPASGRITQYAYPGHEALDIGGYTGAPIYASDTGYVSATGWMGGYGNYIIVNHGNGFDTLYAHLSLIQVIPGQGVQRGQTIGLMGCTGRCTGPHVHFEIRQGGVKRNPIGFLPRG